MMQICTCGTVTKHPLTGEEFPCPMHDPQPEVITFSASTGPITITMPSIWMPGEVWDIKHKDGSRN